MILAALAIAGVGLSAAPEGGDFDRAMALAGELRLAEALVEAEAIGDPLARGQATVYVLFLGRDYAAALLQAERALERLPDPGSAAAQADAAAWLWLQERAAAAALFLEDSESAEHWIGTLAARIDTDLAGDEARAAWRPAAREHAAALASQLDRELRHGRAVARARTVGLAGLALLGLALGTLAVLDARMDRRRPRPRDAGV